MADQRDQPLLTRSRALPASPAFGAGVGSAAVSRRALQLNGTFPACRSFSSSSGAEQDPYKVLGLSRSASDKEIKEAYRKQALRWHPDKNPPDQREEAQKKFSAAANAYEILSDPAKKRQFDSGGGMNGFPGGGGPGPGAYQWRAGPHPHGGFHNQESAEKLFQEVFGGAGGFNALFEQFLGQQPTGGRTIAVGGDVRITTDVHAIHAASRKSGIDSTNDAKRQAAAGKRGKVVKIDTKDQTVKVQIPGIGDAWFGKSAVAPLSPAAGGPQMFFNGGFGGMPGMMGNQSKQEVVRGPDGKARLRVTTTVRKPDGTLEQQVYEQPLSQ